MNITVILNGISRKKKFFYQSILPALVSKHTVEIFETKFAGHAYELAKIAAQNKPEVVFSAGGDGTLHQVLNGLMESMINPLPTLGVIPLGSGNDFAGAVEVTPDANLLLNLLEQGGKPTDVGLITCKDSAGENINRYFINECSVGMGPATIKQMEKAPAWLGANGRYLVSILKTFFSHKPQSVELKTSTWNWSGAVRVLAISNGKSFGNRIYIAPDAMQDDGLFNLFVAADVPLIKFLLYLQKLKRGNKLKDTRIYYSNTDYVEINAVDRVAIEAEGEHVGFLPASIKILPLAISFLRN